MAQAQRGLKQLLQKHPNDIVILSALRTPIAKSYMGGLRNAYPEQMLAAVLRATLTNNSAVPPSAIRDISVGTVLSELGGSKAARMALNHVGYPTSTSLYTINRACSSSLQAITCIADSISMARIDMGIGAGMESMTRNYGSKAVPTVLWPDLKESPIKDARDCIMPMGITSENIAARYGISREDQDAFGVESHKKAYSARERGQFDDEIVPVTVTNPPSTEGGTKEIVTITTDDGIRGNASTESMAKLKPVFSDRGSTTAGNSSQISDGAAACLLARRSTATSLGMSSSIMGKFCGSTVVGVPPDEMGVGPAVAIPALLEQKGLEKEQVDVWEINEAFASQALYCVRALKLEKAAQEGRVNPRGGAIALGHPLGATGARMAATILHEMEEGMAGVLSMCVGTGMGMAALFVRE